MGPTKMEQALAPTPVGSDALVRQPEPFRSRSALPEDIDRDAATWVPVAANPKPARLGRLEQPTTDRHGAVFMKGAMVSEGSQIELERF